MKSNKGLTGRRRWCLRLGLLAWCALPGCLSEKQHNCEDIPAGAIPVCTGTHVREITNKQAEIAEADDFVIYEREWLYDPMTGCGSTRLGPYGQYHLTLMVKRLPEVPFPVLIEVNQTDEKLNAARRAVIVQLLQANGILDADPRVIIGFPSAEGLFGDEAASIFRQGYLHPWRGANTNGNYGGGALGGVGGGGAYGGFGTVGSLGNLRAY